MKNELIVLDDENIESMIYEIRGKQVMLDSDLAKLYKCKNGTKSINLAVKRNINRFPDRFRFQLTNEEYKKLQFQNETANNMNRTLPYVFTEEGVAMLSAVLKTEIAEEISIKIMDAFVRMRKFISNNIDYFKELGLIEKRLIIHDNKIDYIDNNIKLLKESFNKLEEKEMNNLIYFDGQVYDAHSKIIDILNTAKDEIIIIDSYADKKLLDIIKYINKNIIIITRKNNYLKDIDITQYNKQYSNLKVIYDNSFHDRYIIIDNDIFYSLGTSFNHLGNKTFGIYKINEIEFKKLLLNKIKKL